MNTAQLYKVFKQTSGVCTDTRRIKKDAIYFALKGDNFNGNEFAQDALDKGAKFCIIDEEAYKINDRCILVENSLKSLQQLASHHRQVIGVPIIGLTGSNGKTTTKELIYSVLSQHYRVRATQGNLNNHIGVPLTLLSFDADLDFGIVEMGANHQGEIEFLSQIAAPDYGIITNFGKAHLEGFGGIEGVIKGKSELYKHLKARNKTVFINTNDDLQLQQIGQYGQSITFGSNEDNDITISFDAADPYVQLSYDGTKIKTHLIGTYNFNNIAIAVAVGANFGVNTQQIKEGLESYVPKNSRSQIIKEGATTILLDAYNANPTSMAVAITTFNEMNAKDKILILGDMFELGQTALKEHQAIVDIAESSFKEIYLIGENFFDTKTSSSTKKYKSFEAFATHIQPQHFRGSFILLKGSRGMALERFLNLLN